MRILYTCYSLLYAYFVHIASLFIENVDELEYVRGSKYVQSALNVVFGKIFEYFTCLPLIRPNPGGSPAAYAGVLGGESSTI